MVTELVANSVRHAGLSPEETVELVVKKAPDHVRVEVADAGPCFESPIDPNELGRTGLTLVVRLSRRWGWERLRGLGKCVVWSEIDVARQPPALYNTEPWPHSS